MSDEMTVEFVEMESVSGTPIAVVDDTNNFSSKSIHEQMELAQRM